MTVAKNLDLEKYQVIFIGITRQGKWKVVREPKADWEKEAQTTALINPNSNRPSLLFINPAGELKEERIDLIFPMIHGKMGEDGSLQGFLEIAGIPYVGCGPSSSHICFDKVLTNTILEQAGIKVPKFDVIIGEERIEISEFPAFVKPARSGSSFGVTKVKSSGELEAAIKKAQKYDTKVIIEKAIEGTEIGCAVLGNGRELQVGCLDQIELSHGYFHIHQEEEPEKGSENSKVIVPALLSEELEEKIVKTAKEIYKTINCKGLSRIDLFLKKDGTIVLNEVNTMPGFTSYSRYPRMMIAKGWSLPQVIDELIDLAIKK